MKDRKSERDQELAVTQVKKSVDKVYDSIMGNALFIMVNIHILLFLLFAEPKNLAVYYLLLALVLIPVYPAYVALYSALKERKEGKESVYKRFFHGYKKHLKQTTVLGVVGALFTAFMLYNSLFFSIIDQSVWKGVMDILLIFALMLLLGLAPVISEEEGVLKDHLREMGRTLFQSTFRGAAALIVLFISVYFGRFLIFPLVIGFAISVYVQEVLYKRQKERDLPRKQEENKKTRK